MKRRQFFKSMLALVIAPLAAEAVVAPIVGTWEPNADVIGNFLKLKAHAEANTGYREIRKVWFFKNGSSIEFGPAPDYSIPEEFRSSIHQSEGV